MPVKVIFLTTTGAGTWTVPSDWTNTNKIECVGGGAGGYVAVAGGGGGSGGNYSALSNHTGWSAGNTINFTVGAAGSAGTAGGDTWIGATSLASSLVGAKGGVAATSATGATANASSTGFPTSGGTRTAGGNGGTGNATVLTGGGGGGAGGAGGAGGNGGAGDATAAGADFGGGGGSGAGLTTAGGAGGAGTTSAGAGGTNGTGGGSGGAGGSGAGVTATAGTSLWTSTHAADGTTASVVGAATGGGGGGGGSASTGAAGSGANYGGGGGGRGQSTGGTSAGGQGLIVISYTTPRVAKRARWNFNDLTKIWQESSKTTAAAVDSPIGYVEDAYGTGLDVQQSGSSRRPTLRYDSGRSRYYAEFDAFDDFLEPVTATSLNFDEFVFFAAIIRVSTGSTTYPVVLGIPGNTGDIHNCTDGFGIYNAETEQLFKIEANSTSLSASIAETMGNFNVEEIYKTATSATTLINGTAGTADTSFTVADDTYSGNKFLVGMRRSTFENPFSGRMYSVEFDGTSGISSGTRTAIRDFHTTGGGASGTASITLGALTLSAAGTQSAPVGTASITLGALTLSSAGAAPAVGAASLSLGALTLSSAGRTAAVGTASVSLGALTVSSAGAAPAVGTASPTLGAITVSSTGLAPVVGTAALSLGALTVASAGVAPVVGSAAITLGALTLASSTSTTIIGTLSTTLGALTVSSAGVAPAVGAASLSLGALTVSSAGAAPAVGSLAATLGALTVSSAGVAPVVGTASLTLGPLTVFASSGTPALTGTAAVTLGDLTLTAAGAAQAAGSATVTLGALTLTSAGTVTGGIAADRWDAANSSTVISLSNSDLTATRSATSAGQHAVALGTRSRDTGDYFYSVLINLSSGGDIGVGLAKAGVTLDYPGSYAGAGNDPSGFFWYNNSWREGGGTAGGGGSAPSGFANGDLIGIRKAGSTITLYKWISSAWSAIETITGLGSGNWYPALALKQTGDAGTADFAALTLPDTSVSWDGSRTGGAGAVGSAAITLDALTLVTEGVAPVVGTAAITLGPLTVAGTGRVAAVGSLSVTLDPLTVSSSSGVPAVGSAAVSLGALTLSATGAALATGSLSQTLGGLTLASAGVAGGIGDKFDAASSSTVISLSNADLTATRSATNAGRHAITIGSRSRDTGDYFYTVRIALSASGDIGVGLAKAGVTLDYPSSYPGAGNDPLGFFWYNNGWREGGGTAGGGGAAPSGFGDGDLVGVRKAGSTVTLYKWVSGAWSAVETLTGLGAGDWFPALALKQQGDAGTADFAATIRPDTTVSWDGSQTGAAGALGIATLPLGALTLAATGAAPAAGSLSRTLGALTLTSAGTVVPLGTAAGTAALTLGSLTISATGLARAAGALSVPLDPLTLFSAGSVQGELTPVVGTANVALGGLTLVARGLGPPIPKVGSWAAFEKRGGAVFDYGRRGKAPRPSLYGQEYAELRRRSPGERG